MSRLIRNKLCFPLQPITKISLVRCWSYIGKMGGAQDVSLMKEGCMVRGVVQHEIQHALGFFHEQSRSDRDKFVDVRWQNINKGTNCKLCATNNEGNQKTLQMLLYAMTYLHRSWCPDSIVTCWLGINHRQLNSSIRRRGWVQHNFTLSPVSAKYQPDWGKNRLGLN